VLSVECRQSQRRNLIKTFIAPAPRCLRLITLYCSARFTVFLDSTLFVFLIVSDLLNSKKISALWEIDNRRKREKLKVFRACPSFNWSANWLYTSKLNHVTTSIKPFGFSSASIDQEELAEKHGVLCRAVIGRKNLLDLATPTESSSFFSTRAISLWVGSFICIRNSAAKSRGFS
jgi:hypothetical protein